MWTGEWEKDPGYQELLAYAYKEGRVLVTIDKGFGELAVVREIRHSGIVRLVNFSAREQAKACLYVISRYGSDLAQGAIVTIEAHRVRIRPPENTN